MKSCKMNGSKEMKLERRIKMEKKCVFGRLLKNRVPMSYLKSEILMAPEEKFEIFSAISES